jgi:hypothetical protein
MKRIAMLIMAAALMTTAVGAASANTWTPRVDRREARQHARIIRGVRQGQLSHREAMRLRMRERHIHRMEWRAKSDGRVTWRERVQLNRALNRGSREIYRDRHNRRYGRQI